MTSDRFHWGAGAQIANRRARWAEIRREVQSAVQRGAEQPILQPYVAISRKAGAGGDELAARLGELLRWRVLAKEILDEVADELQLDPKVLSLLDETRLSWFGESVLSLVHARLVSQDVYVERIIKMVFVVLSHESAVIVGRGATGFLPPQRGLAVRLVADEADRIARIAALEKLDESAARHRVHDADRARLSFVRHHFHMDADEPLGYDLVVNTSRTGIEGAARIVVAALTARGLLPPDTIG